MEWIPIEERTPKNGEYALVSFSNYGMPCIAEWREDEEGGAFFVETEDRSLASLGLFVNAWMELPERYEG